MSSTHTPGPWVAGDVRYQRDFRTFVNVRNEREDFVACVSADPMTAEAISANARLIAAAPQLLADVTEAERMFRWYGDLHAAKPDPEKAARNYEMADRLAAAIAAATGGAA